MIALLLACSAPGEPGNDFEVGEQDTAGDSGVAWEHPGYTVDPSVLLGGVWRLDLDDGTWIEPAGFGDVITTAFSSDAPALGVMQADESSLELRWGWLDGETGTQEVCAETKDLDVDFAWNPRFLFGPKTVHGLSWGPVSTRAEDVRFQGTFSADGLTLSDGVVDVTLDLRETETDTCELLEGLGFECSPCADGHASCLRLHVEDVPGERTGWYGLSPITELDDACL